MSSTNLILPDKGQDPTAIAEETAVVISSSADRIDPRLKPQRCCVPVLHLINGEHYSGAERVQDLLALRLGEFGYQVGFACVKPGKFASARVARQAALHAAPMAGKFDLRVVRRIARLVRERDYRLIHAHTPRTAMIGRLAAMWTHVPLVYHVHSPTSHDSTRGWRNRVNAWIERLSVGGAARLIAVSHSLGRHMQTAGCAGDRLRVVPNGVPALADVPHRRCPAGDWTLGTVALFRPRKGTEVLIDALAELRRQDLPAKLLCVGGFDSPDYERQLKARVAEHGLQEHVEWTGFTSEVNEQLHRMDLFVLPSLFGEGLPMVVLEAMAAGAPVVATDVEGVPEAIRDGVDGVVVPPQDAERLAAGIARVMRGELDWEKLRLSALVRQGDHFSDRSMAAGVAAVYDEILRSNQ